jgi:hypothetical protein
MPTHRPSCARLLPITSQCEGEDLVTFLITSISYEPIISVSGRISHCQVPTYIVLRTERLRSGGLKVKSTRRNSRTAIVSSPLPALHCVTPHPHQLLLQSIPAHRPPPHCRLAANESLCFVSSVVSWLIHTTQQAITAKPCLN